MNRYIIAAIILIVTSPLANGRTVESDNFILTDGYGRTTAQLTKSGEGTPALFFYDMKGVPRISIGLYSDGVPGVVLNDDKGNASAIMRLMNNGGEPVIVLKENGQDKYIIDKNGIPEKGVEGNSNIMILLVALLGGIVGGFIPAYYIKNTPSDPNLVKI